MDDGWKEVRGSDTTEMWDRTGTITGKYVDMRSQVGPNNSNVYVLETENGNIGVWGSAVLDTKFEEIAPDSMVKIESLGKVKGQRGTEYYDYRVFSKSPETTSLEDKVMDIMGNKE